MPRENGSGPLGKRGLTAIRGPNRHRAELLLKQGVSLSLTLAAAQAVLL